ncbi:unnamed protein product [Fusarium venenatum]|uniref:Uncharacterized protein n=1 Tax=Fusarium venenatum TaxID=56646 RepID=A0A2L2TY79_9HYPO|nr:uncharacterized protein FVRRES_02347 [Fusarium venenatum]CEI65835.1 unnamed protein product [Fusarium venenatum]
MVTSLRVRALMLFFLLYTNISSFTATFTSDALRAQHNAMISSSPAVKRRSDICNEENHLGLVAGIINATITGFLTIYSGITSSSTGESEGGADVDEETEGSVHLETSLCSRQYQVDPAALFVAACKQSKRRDASLTVIHNGTKRVKARGDIRYLLGILCMIIPGKDTTSLTAWYGYIQQMAYLKFSKPCSNRGVMVMRMGKGLVVGSRPVQPSSQIAKVNGRGLDITKTQGTKIVGKPFMFVP